MSNAANIIAVPSASAKTISQIAGSQPSMRDTITGWSEQLTMVRLLKKIVDRENVNEEREFTCMGMLQPFSAREVAIKPEGQRRWRWYRLHVSAAVDLEPGEEFIMQGFKYKIMSDLPYHRNGYYEYELVQTFTGQDKASGIQ
jgi:hypothetical protein